MPPPTVMKQPPNEEIAMKSNSPTSPGAGNFRRTTSLLLGLPFDLAREQYAQAVRWGLLKNSLLASARFARELARAERQTLGPWARQI